tara:strand:- start:447 stop:965 length:519 start_codon:yes stop_codon:yes gene_type:complete
MRIRIINIPFFKLNLGILFFFFFGILAYSQPALPQRTITVQATQSLHFGTFALIGSNSGTVTVGYDGTRTSNNIYLSPISPTSQPAIFDIKLCQGRNVTITYAPTTTLTGSNGGTFTMNIGPTEKGISGTKFAVDTNCNFITTIRVGGTLNIPSFSPAGVYTGTFEIIFEQE